MNNCTTQYCICSSTHYVFDVIKAEAMAYEEAKGRLLLKIAVARSNTPSPNLEDGLPF